MERPTREFALQLISSKEKIESEVLALLDVLKLVLATNWESLNKV